MKIVETGGEKPCGQQRASRVRRSFCQRCRKTLQNRFFAINAQGFCPSGSPIAIGDCGRRSFISPDRSGNLGRASFVYT
jgi:hypothetical protein